MIDNAERELSELALSQSVPPPAELTDLELEAVTAGKGGGLGGPASGLGVRPGVGVGAPGFGWRRGAG